MVSDWLIVWPQTWMSSLHQQWFVLYGWSYKQDLFAVIHTNSIDPLSWQEFLWQYQYSLLEMCVNGMYTISGLESWICLHLYNCINLYYNYWPTIWATMVPMISLPPSEIECQWSVNYVWLSKVGNQRAMRWYQAIMNASATIIGKNGTHDILTTIYKDLWNFC